MNPYFQILFFFSTDPFCSVWCHAVSVVVTVLVVRFGHWVCGESWHAIKGSLTHRPSSQGWAPGVLPLCVSMCMFGGLSSFYIWVEGLCVVGWWGEGGEGGGGGSGFFLVFFFVFYS